MDGTMKENIGKNRASERMSEQKKKENEIKRINNRRKKKKIWNKKNKK